MERIAEARPKQLFLIADGPRSDRPGEAEACERARSVAEELVDWDCEVHRHYSETNLGCGHRPASGIDWLFEQVESAIILEDDCVAHPSFFSFCDKMLRRYREDERVMHISGCTYRAEPWDTDDSYFFTRFPACWGWATWRRAWHHFDIHCKDWPRLRETRFLNDITGAPAVADFWGAQFDEATLAPDDLHFWDYQWAFACWANNGLAACPRRNLISNIGWGEGATHTTDANEPSLSLPTFEMASPLKHPPNVLPDPDLNRQYVEEFLLPSALQWQAEKNSSPLKEALKRSLLNPMKRSIRRMIR
ncbi:MAG: hypothetical protein KTR15_14010 [Phycisphaeraceae bacterium]|nr:hypothetical protein [Phycisphaeraceae bacterium]